MLRVNLQKERYIKIAMKAFHWDSKVEYPIGKALDIYYDRKTDSFVIENFPYKDDQFELSMAPSSGFAKITIGEEVFNLRFYDH